MCYTPRRLEKKDIMLTASEYIAMPDGRKRAFALAVDELDRLCAEAVGLRRRMMVADICTADGRSAYERLETALLCKRNEINARQMDYHMNGICVTISTDDTGNPIRVRKPAGFKSIEALVASDAVKGAQDEAGAESGQTALPAERRRSAKSGPRSARKNAEAK